MRKQPVWKIRPALPKESFRNVVRERLNKPCHYLVKGSRLSGREAVYRLLAGCHSGKTVLMVTRRGQSLCHLLTQLEEAECFVSPDDLILISDVGDVLGSVDSDQQARQLIRTGQRRIWFCCRGSLGTRYLTEFVSYERLLRATVTDRGRWVPPGVEHCAHFWPGARLVYCVGMALRVIQRNLRQMKSDLSLQVFDGLLRKTHLLESTYKPVGIKHTL